MLDARPATFDAVAETYDSTFSRTELGRLLRERTRTRLARFEPGTRVLELGCGTGEDAVWLAKRGVNVLATDASPAMLEQTRAKAQRAGVDAQIETQVVDLEKPPPLPRLAGEGQRVGVFDGAFSNFGALNCVRDLKPLARWLAAQVKPGGRVVLVVMGPLCPWEIAHAVHYRDWQTATRRLRREGVIANVGGNLVRVFYPGPRAVAKIFAPYFRQTHLEGIGVLLPPPYLPGLAARRPHLIQRLANWEARVASRFPFNLMGDHYLSELARVESRS